MTEGTDGYSGGRVEWGRRHSASIAPAGHTILPVLHMLSDPEALWIPYFWWRLHHVAMISHWLNCQSLSWRTVGMGWDTESGLIRTKALLSPNKFQEYRSYVSEIRVKDQILEQKMFFVLSSSRKLRVSGAVCQELGSEAYIYIFSPYYFTVTNGSC